MSVETMEINRPEHGGNIYRISEETGIPASELIDFSASINPLGISDRVKEAIRAELDNLVHYPDPDASELRQVIAQYHNIDPNSIICGNGSTELIYLLPAALKPGKVLITAPAFSEYGNAIKSGEIKELTLKKEDSYKIIAREFIEVMQGCDMAFLCNPNNPTGDLLTKEEVLRIAEAAREMKCLLVLDEAFIDFCPADSVIGHVQGNPYLIVLRSMTKFYAITGLRAGYGVFHPDIIERIKEFKEPWTMNTLAQKAAIAAIDDIDYAARTMDLIKNEKEFIENGLRDIGIEFFPSAINFYLIKTGNSVKICEGMKEKGIILRDCSNFRGLDDSYIRVAVKSRKDNEILLGALSAVGA
ncbi:threonine-phosphate decarboxylase [bacterium BMS3Bbin09]|nr:threonine-phosphate decarboxylase [bacterium BMS3Bbin09]HDH34694.1 threonine-phosphate decarboxylase [Nitrospirota bacterium]